MATTACTINNLVVGVANNITGGTEIVTFNTPKPTWTEANYSDSSQIAIQCNAIALGGFNGLNS